MAVMQLIYVKLWPRPFIEKPPGDFGLQAGEGGAPASSAGAPPSRAPVRGQTPIGLTASGVTAKGGQSLCAPLGKVASRHHSPIRFVHLPKRVCNRGFKGSALRKHARRWS